MAWQEGAAWQKRGAANVGALIITYTILVVPYYNYSIMAPKPYSNQNYSGPYIISWDVLAESRVPQD